MPHRNFQQYEGSEQMMPTHQSNFAADIADLKARMIPVEAGVANFKKFQEGANEFFTTSKVNEQNKQALDRKRARIHYWLLTALIAVVGALATALLEGHHF